MKRGFTTIEMIVIIGVIVLLVSMVMVYGRGSERQIILFKEQAKLINILFKTKTLSIATFGKTGVPCGYGMHFMAPRNYIIFKDMADDCSKTDFKYSGPQEMFESFHLDSAVVFGNLTLTDIIFYPPDPLVVIDNDFLKTEGLIEIKTVDGKSNGIIKVNNAGQITKVIQSQ